MPEILLKTIMADSIEAIDHYVLAPQRGLEPRTCWLTASRSTDWATGEHILKDSDIFYPKINSPGSVREFFFWRFIIQEEKDVNSN